MENTEKPLEQCAISILLIMGIFFVTILFMICTNVTENEALRNWSLVFPLLTVLMAAYVYTYRGKEQRTARKIFAILIILSIIGFFIYAGIKGMAAAFSHG